MTRDVVAEDERSRMLFGKLRRAVVRKFGCGVKENKISSVLIFKMSTKERTRFLGYGGLYHMKRIYRALFTCRVNAVNVKVQEGVLKGRKMTSVLRKPYYRFQGIPYAKPPVGPLRFKDPQPPEPWEGVRSALKEGNIACQADLITGLTRGSEDCLFLNVFTPELPREGVRMELKPVLVWIHGGGFNLGSGNAEVYGPDFLMEEDVVLVTFNYRLGVMGFLSTGTEDAPGNAGLKDIVQALKWVKRNIEVFGGNPNKVTVFGESAGGAAVHYLMLSELGKGLFHRAISQSGSALCPWALINDPLASAFKLGRAFGIDTKDPKVLVEYLRKVSAKVLVKKQSAAVSEVCMRECVPFAFLPCVEPASYPNAFLKQHPVEMLQNRILHSDVPYITGVNEMEGMIMLRAIIDKLPPPKDLDRDFERVVPRWLNLRYGSEKSKEASKMIREFYFNNKPLNEKTYKEYAVLMSDTFFVMPVVETSRLQAQFAKSPIFNYHFLYDGKMGLFKRILNIKNIPGPGHADELGYLFHIPILGPSLDQKSPDMKVRKKMVRLWVNFAKYGHPTPRANDPDLGKVFWKPFSEDDQHYLIINENLSAARNMNSERVNFWSKVKESLFGAIVPDNKSTTAVAGFQRQRA